MANKRKFTDLQDIADILTQLNPINGPVNYITKRLPWFSSDQAISARKAAYDKVNSGQSKGSISDRERGMALRYAVENAKDFKYQDIPRDLRKYYDLSNAPDTTLGGTVYDTLQTAKDFASAGLLSAPPKAVPETATLSNIAGGTLGGIAGLLLPWGKLAGTGKLLSRMARVGGALGGAHSTKEMLEGGTVGDALSVGIPIAALGGAGEAVAPALGAIARRVGLDKLIPNALKRGKEAIASQESVTAGPTAEDILQSMQNFSRRNAPQEYAAGIGQKLSDAAAEKVSSAQALRDELFGKYSDLMNQAVKERKNVGEYRFSPSSRASELPTIVNPEGDVIPAQALEQSAESVRPPQVSQEATPPELLPAVVPTEDITKIAHLKMNAAHDLFNSMMDEVRDEAATLWNAAGRPTNKFDDYVRAIAEKHGYDYNKLSEYVNKTLPGHVQDIENLFTAGNNIKIANAPLARTNVLNELMHYVADTPKRVGTTLSEGVPIGGEQQAIKDLLVPTPKVGNISDILKSASVPQVRGVQKAAPAAETKLAELLPKPKKVTAAKPVAAEAPTVNAKKLNGMPQKAIKKTQDIAYKKVKPIYDVLTGGVTDKPVTLKKLHAKMKEINPKYNDVKQFQALIKELFAVPHPNIEPYEIANSADTWKFKNKLGEMLHINGFKIKKVK